MSTKKSKTTVEEEVKKQNGFFSKLILLGILPLFYTIGLGMVILHFSGVSFPTQVKWIEDHTKPLFADKQQTAKAKETNQKTVSKVKGTSGSGNKAGTTASNSGSSVNNTTATKTSTGSAASNTARNSDTTVENGTAPVNEAPSETSVVTDSLTNMDPKDAAKMLSNMSEGEAVKNLKRLERDVQTAIMAEMPAEEGARLAVAIESGNEAETTTSSSLQLYQQMTPEQIAAILKGISDRSEVLRQIKQLDPKTASKVVSQLDPQVAGWIVLQMN